MEYTKKLDKQNVEDMLPLTPLQEGMLFYYLNEPESELYFEQLSFRLEGDIRMDAFMEAWQFVVISNQMLRAVYRWQGIERPVQIVLKEMTPPIREYDFSNSSGENQQKLLDELKEKDRKERIDISDQPYRILCCKLGHDTCEMVFSSYHIIYDGWSNGIILREFLEAYSSICDGREPLRNSKTGYREYIRWIQGQDKSKQEKYWEEYLCGFDSKTLLPTDYKKQKDAVEDKNYMAELPEEMTEEIRICAREQNVTIATLLYTAWGILLQKYNNTSDVLFGTTLSGRTPEIKGIEDVVGLFINTLPLRIKSLGDESVTELLGRVELMLRDRAEFESASLTTVKTVSALDSKEELFDSIIVVENYPLGEVPDEITKKVNIKLTSIFEMTNYDLTLVISTFNNIGLRFIYDEKIFKKETIIKLSDHFMNIIKGILKNPEKKLSEIEMMSEKEIQHILFDFNSLKMNYPRDCTIYKLFEAQVEKTPDNVAVTFDNASLTYRELNEKANKLARMLRSKGVMTEVIVAVMMERSLDLAVSLIAILKAGGAYLPIDPATPVDRVIYMMNDSAAKVLLTNSEAIKGISFTSLQNFEANSDIAIVVTETREHIKDFDSLPVPDRSLIDLRKYKNKIGMASVNNCIALQTTRGCPYKCLYCHKIWSKNHVRRSAENIFNEIEYYYKNGVTNFAVIDDCFNLDMKNGSELFKLIIKNKLKIQLFFPNGLRGDILTPEYIDLMIEAGTRGINLSLETASPRLQKLLKKNLDLDRFKHVVEYIATKHSDIILEMATMHGFPTETEEEAMMTLNFIKDIKWLHFPYIHILKIFPNTEMEEFALANGVSKKDILISKDRAFHELPETLPFPKSFTRKYQAKFMNEYFLSKERLKQVLPVQMRILDESALAQKYNAYLPVEIRSIQDVVNFAELDDFVLPEDCLSRQEASAVRERITIFDRKPAVKVVKPEAKKILFLDLSQHFTSRSMLYKVAEQPIGQIYLLTYLNKVFGEKINGRIYKSGNDFDSFEELKAIVDEYKPDLLGIRTLTYFKEFFHETVSLLRQWGVNAPIITGGPYASSDYDTILMDKNVNLVIFGEGEYTMAELVSKMLENNFKLPKQDVLKTIKGIAFAENPVADKSREILLLDRLKDNIEVQEKFNLDIISRPDNLAYVMYTSGSTGKPKGVMVEHQQVNNCIFWMQKEFKLSAKDVIVQRTNLTFDPSVWEFFWPLYIGASVRQITIEQGKDAEFLLNLMTGDNCPTMMYCPASLVTGMTYLLKEKEYKPRLKMPWLIIGAEPIGMEVIQNFYRYFDGTVVNTYGPTECTINNTYYYLDRDDKRTVVPIGQPVANNQIYILSKQLQPLPIKMAGEIYIAGESNARGYINNSEKTAQVFLDNPFGKGKLYKTGDIGRWLEDGNIEILGRGDEQVKIRGYRIELGEIENALLSHPSVKSCVAIVKDNKKTKSEEKVCKQCKITSTYPGVNINDDGVCDICQDLNMYKKYADQYFKNMEDLDSLLKEMHSTKKSKYDCILLYSGGRGSAYALYRLVDQGYKVLAITYDNGYFSKSELENISKTVGKLGVDHVVLSHKNTAKILKESCKLAHTVCRGCFHTSSSLAAEYAYKNNIGLVIGATLSRGQILENKLIMFYKQGISDVGEIEKQLLSVQKSTPTMDKSIFDQIDIDVVKDGSAYDKVKFVDFYRYCDITNEEMISYLNDRDEYWKTRKNYAIYSTNCPIKQIGDYCHMHEKGYHYYGAATSWEKRMGHISLENVTQDLQCNVSQSAFENFAKRIGYENEKPVEEIETKYICAYIVSEDELPANELREHIARVLPAYMIPSHFVQINEIPLTANGKIDKKALPEPMGVVNTGIEYVPPDNEMEENLAEIWQKVLGLERIGVHDNFFDIGGNSILLIQMHTQIEKRYPAKVTMTDLFAYTTISALAKVMSMEKEIEYKELSLPSLELPEEFFTVGNESGEGAMFQFRFSDDLFSKLKAISSKEGVSLQDMLIAMYIYLLSELTEQKEITVHSILKNEQTIVLKINMGQLANFSELFSLVGQNGIEKNKTYPISDIKNAKIIKDAHSILPLVYDKDVPVGGLKLLEVYDTVLEIEQGSEDIKFVFEYNRKMLKEKKIKEIVNGYVELIELFVEKYEI